VSFLTRTLKEGHGPNSNMTSSKYASTGMGHSEHTIGGPLEMIHYPAPSISTSQDGISKPEIAQVITIKTGKFGDKSS
jgi:hypothetical protein